MSDDPQTLTPTGERVALGELAVTPRPLSAYRDMFLLDDDDLSGGPILDCPAGGSPFGAQVRALGGEVVSVDPAYRTAPAALVGRTRADLHRIVAWQQRNPDAFNWSYLGSPQSVERLWSDAIDEFAADFTLDGARYVAAALPNLPFPDRHFALTLSGFLLFVYPELLDLDDHLASLLELTRVTDGEVRVYPLTDTVGHPYARLPELQAALRDHGVDSVLRATGCTYTPEPDSDRMLVCRRR